MTTLRLDAPISFWGGLDPETGVIVDVHHPQCGESIVGRVLVLERTSGSTSSAGALVEAIRRGRGPKEIVVAEPDMTIESATWIARALYGIEVPVTVSNRTANRTQGRGE